MMRCHVEAGGSKQSASEQSKPSVCVRVCLTAEPGHPVPAACRNPEESVKEPDVDGGAGDRPGGGTGPAAVRTGGHLCPFSAW